MIKALYRWVLPQSVRKPIRMWRLEREFHPDAEVEFYGAYDLLVRHLGERKLPYRYRRRINWQHGWYPDYYQEGSDDPFVTTQNWAWSDPDRYNLVARKSEEERMHGFGVPNTMAVGLPIVYTPTRRFERRKGSLLVMPGHSLDYISLVTRESEYVSYIDSIRGQFSSVTVCLHPSCKRNGYWIESFRKHGYPIVMGVEIQEMGSFYKLQRYFSEHEYCTTNLTGSHVIYSTLYGCKVSIIGPVPTISLDDLKNSIHWADRKDKHGLLHSYDRMSVPVFRNYYPQFFVDHPKSAVEHVELARYECGFDNRMSPSQYREIVDWVTRKPVSEP
jgi:hypothetical protein